MNKLLINVSKSFVQTNLEKCVISCFLKSDWRISTAGKHINIFRIIVRIKFHCHLCMEYINYQVQ